MISKCTAGQPKGFVGIFGLQALTVGYASFRTSIICTHTAAVATAAAQTWSPISLSSGNFFCVSNGQFSGKKEEWLDASFLLQWMGPQREKTMALISPLKSLLFREKLHPSWSLFYKSSEKGTQNHGWEVSKNCALRTVSRSFFVSSLHWWFSYFFGKWSTKPQKINALLTQMSRISQEKLKKVEVFCPEVILLLLKVYHLVNYWFDAVSWGLKLRGAGSQKPIYINVQ